MSKHARRLNLAANALFLMAGCTYAFLDVMNTVVYRLALIVILFLFRILWTKAMIRRAVKLENQRTLTSLADSLISLDRQDTLQYEISARDLRSVRQHA